MKNKSRLAFDLLLKEMELVSNEERLSTLGGIGELYKYQTDPNTGQIQRFHSNSNGMSWFQDYGYNGGYDSNWVYNDGSSGGSSGGNTGRGGNTSSGGIGGIGFLAIKNAIINGNVNGLAGGVYTNLGGNDWTFRPNNSDEIFGKIEIPGVGTVYYRTDQTKEIHDYYFDNKTQSGSTGAIMLPEIKVSASGVANYGPLQDFMNRYRISNGETSYFDVNKYNSDVANGIINAKDVSYRNLVEVFGGNYYSNYSHYNSNGADGGGYNSAGYNSSGYNVYGVDANGIDQDGANSYGYNSNGVLLKGDGYDYRGYNSAGYNRDGYNSANYNSYGYSLEQVKGASNEMVEFMEMLANKGLAESIKSFAPYLRSDFEKRLFEQYWYGEIAGSYSNGISTQGTMELSANEFDEIRSAVNSISPIPDVSQSPMGIYGVNGPNYYIHPVSTYGNDTYDYGIGSALGIYLASGQLVGVYNNYNFNPGNRNPVPEAARSLINAFSPEGAQSFYISGGDYPEELRELLQALIP